MEAVTFVRVAILMEKRGGEERFGGHETPGPSDIPYDGLGGIFFCSAIEQLQLLKEFLPSPLDQRLLLKLGSSKS